MAARPVSAPRKQLNSSLGAKKASVSPVRRLPRSSNTSPIRAFASPLKDYSNYTPLLLSRERSSSSFKSTPKSPLSSFTSDAVPRQKSSALDSMRDLTSKTAKLDQESKRFAEKVDKVKQQMQRGRSSKAPGTALKSLARTCAKVVERLRTRLLSAAIDRVRAKAKKTEALERQGQRFLAKLRLRNHFAAWRTAFCSSQVSIAQKREKATKHYQRQLKRRLLRLWRTRGAPETVPQPPSLSPKLERKPLASSNKRRVPSESPKPARSPALRRDEKPKGSTFKPKVEQRTDERVDEATDALLVLAVEHHRMSSIFYHIWKPWKQVVFEKRDRATRHYRRVVGASVFHAWLEFYVESCEGREEASEHMLLSDSFEEAASTSHYDAVVSAFRLVVSSQQVLGPRVFSHWKEFVTVSRSEKEQEHRRDLMWHKVNSWLEQYKTQP